MGSVAAEELNLDLRSSFVPKTITDFLLTFNRIKIPKYTPFAPLIVPLATLNPTVPLSSYLIHKRIYIHT